MTKDVVSWPSPAEQRFRENLQEYQDYLPLTERAQSQLRDDVELLQSQESWDPATQRGIAVWVDDRENIFRFLRRNNYDAEKTHSVLLAALSNRIVHSLHSPIPEIPPYSDCSLFYILPPSRFTDRLGRPIAVLTIREVRRDGNGKLDDLGQWIWWASELCRRTSRDYWVRGRWNGDRFHGRGGEGCVVIIDAGGAGYRNMEVELLPTLGAVGPKNFPGMVDTAYIVNAGWTQRRLWQVLQKILPRSTMEKIRLLDTPAQVGEFFDLDRLPKAYGGRDPFIFSPSDNPVLKHYQRTTLSNETSGPSTRAASFSSVADVLITAPKTSSTAGPSRRLSLGQSGAGVGDGLRMTLAPVAQFNDHPYQSPFSTAAQSPSDDRPSTSVKNTHEPTTSRSSTLTPMQRIKSLTNFHLYLSPSRLAQVDLLSDSSDGGSIRETGKRQARIVTQPAQVDHVSRSARRSRPPLRIHGIPSRLTSDQQVRSYSDQLQLHHAQRLEKLDSQALMTSPHPAESQPVETQVERESRVSSAYSSQQDARPISAFSRSSNPWFGYPAILIPDASHPGSVLIRPRYRRNRKRDLVKTLLFLFMLRLQSWRDLFERNLGLNRLASWRSRGHEAKNPSEGLIMSATSGKGLIVRSRAVDKDWIWMVIGFILLRGTWTKVLAAPLQALGLESIRDLLGLP